MAALSVGTDDIITQSGVTIAAPDASFTPAAGTYANQTVTYNKLQLQVEDAIFNCLFNKAIEIASTFKQNATYVSFKLLIFNNFLKLNLVHLN